MARARVSYRLLDSPAYCAHDYIIFTAALVPHTRDSALFPFQLPASLLTPPPPPAPPCPRVYSPRECWSSPVDTLWTRGVAHGARLGAQGRARARVADDGKRRAGTGLERAGAPCVRAALPAWRKAWAALWMTYVPWRARLFS
jgi:hypothetical protein